MQRHVKKPPAMMRTAVPKTASFLLKVKIVRNSCHLSSSWFIDNLGISEIEMERSREGRDAQKKKKTDWKT